MTNSDELDKFLTLNGWSNLEDYDTDHAKYRSQVFIQVMENVEQAFVNSYRFEGDDAFTLAKQRIFLKTWFRHGQAGMINSARLIMDNLSKEVKIDIVRLLNEDDVKVNSLMVIDNTTHIPVMVAANRIDIDDRMITGTGSTVFRNNTTPRSFRVSRDNTAFAVFNSNWKSGWVVFFPMAYMFASGDAVLKKKLGLLDTKLVNNKVNNTVRNINYDTIYKINSSFLELAPSQGSYNAEGMNSSKIDISKMLDTKLAKADFSNGEKIGELIDFICRHRDMWYKELGMRREMGQNAGSDRSIMQDYDSEEIHYRTIEQEYEDQLNLFCEDYKRVFGREIRLVKKSEEINSELEEKQARMAGRSGKEENGSDKTENV